MVLVASSVKAFNTIDLFGIDSEDLDQGDLSKYKESIFDSSISPAEIQRNIKTLPKIASQPTQCAKTEVPKRGQFDDEPSSEAHKSTFLFL